MPTFEEIIQNFEGPQKNTSTGVMVRCPAHPDHTPSLHLLRGEQTVGVWCYAGCERDEVISAAGLQWSDLRYEPRPSTSVDGPLQGPLVMDMAYRYLRPDGSVHMTVERWHTDRGGKTFKQRGPSGEYGLPRGFKPCLFNLPSVIPHCQKGGEVWVVEGEKDVETLSYHGLVATTAPMGAGKWQAWYWRWLQGAQRVVVVADNDEPGRKHAAQVADDLTRHGLDVHVVRARQGKDATDHFRWGHTAQDFVPFNPRRVRPQGIDFRSLMGKRFPPITWAVPGILPSGLALLGGPPKKGKSWTALDLGLAVAGGGNAVLGPKCCGGDVLYLSLDNDSENRIQDRARLILGRRNIDCDLPIEFHTEWPTGIEAIAACRDWMKEAHAPRMIVVDTLVKVEPDFDSPNFGAYSHSTDALTRWAQLAIEGNLTILTVHHDRKGGLVEDGDWIDRFTGSRGITATASTLLFLDVPRSTSSNAANGVLHMTGRDVGDFDIPITHGDNDPLWKATNLPHGAILHAVPDTPAELVDEMLGGETVPDTYERPDLRVVSRETPQQRLL